MRQVGTGIAVALCISVAGWSAELKPADLVFTGGTVKTPTGNREAVAVRDGVIVAVGSNAEVDAYVGTETKTVTLGGRAVMPGLHDMHVHALFAGMEQTACGFPQAASPEVILETVAACVAKKQPGEWVLGGNWVAAVFEGGQQTAAFLDQVSPDNPVILSDESHHSVWVNSKALEVAGITSESADPPGGIIEKSETGEPTGLLRETATNLVEKIVPTPSESERRAALELSTSQMLSFGITTFTDASIREENISVYGQLSREGKIKQRVRGCIVWESSGNSWRAGGYDLAESLIRERHTFEAPRYKLDCIKMFLDGVPTESRTGAMLQPYHGNGPHKKNEYGMLMIDQELLEQVVAKFDRQGMNIKFHAAGDRAVRAALDAVEYARDVNGWMGRRHHVGHSTFVSEADIPRVRALGMAWEFSPYIWYPTPMASVDIMRVVGPERMKRWVPIRDAVESRALVTVGSDWSIVPSVNPWLAIETMVTRELPGGSSETLGRGQAVPLSDALKIMTENAALLMDHRDRVGSIEVGMEADLIVIAADPEAIDIRTLSNMRVDQTYIAGELVFDRTGDE